MQPDPGDDFMARIEKIVEDLIRNLQDKEQNQFIGCATHHRQPTRCQQDSDDAVPAAGKCSFELIDAGDRYYLTVTMPPGIQSAPDIDIRTNSVGLSVSGHETVIPVSHAVDMTRSSYSIRHQRAGHHPHQDQGVEQLRLTACRIEGGIEATPLVSLMSP